MATVLTEGRHPAEFILSEANGQRSRGNITIAENQEFEAGQVLAEITASGEYVAHDPAGAGGAAVATAIALYGATTEEGETADISAIVRDAEVNGKILIYKTGITAPQTEAAIEALADQGIIVR
ncbi:head decoration protein [Bradyrhizobium valentinum]|uniref:Head decoration protein n=1 Tax=Bradyrhizobium valentinum TaxID=1518501 RepID=A0A0R3KU96_9BRAD|nr:head decoration protein [Bradyrhizobium valentinum]KRQ99272.1 hypothetical protein CP49_11795 [Bradyrhizobium valentinum]